jgi:hypothetical protein
MREWGPDSRHSVGFIQISLCKEYASLQRISVNVVHIQVLIEWMCCSLFQDSIRLVKRIIPSMTLNHAKCTTCCNISEL